MRQVPKIQKVMQKFCYYLLCKSVIISGNVEKIRKTE